MVSLMSQSINFTESEMKDLPQKCVYVVVVPNEGLVGRADYKSIIIGVIPRKKLVGPGLSLRSLV